MAKDPPNETFGLFPQYFHFITNLCCCERRSRMSSWWCCGGDSTTNQQEQDKATMPLLRIVTADFGTIDLRLRPDAAPVTVEYISHAVRAGLYSQQNAHFYRSDFVVQCGLHGTGLVHPQGDLPVNETATGVRLSNKAGTASIGTLCLFTYF